MALNDDMAVKYLTLSTGHLFKDQMQSSCSATQLGAGIPEELLIIFNA